MADYDVIVIGAGHNGLTAAAALAKAGRRVLVLERRDATGGLCAGEEFHPGYRHSGLLGDTNGVRPGVVDALALERHGLDLLSGPQPVLTARPDGPGLTLHHDPGVAADEIGLHSATDAKAYREFHAFVARARRVVEPLVNDIPPDVDGGFPALMGLAKHGLAFRRMGGSEMMELLRVPPMCVADWLGEWFESDVLKASLSMPAVLGTWAGPWSPGTSANLLLWLCTASRPVKGGAAALATALERAATHYGAEVRTGASVKRIRVERGAAIGVELEGGDEIDAPAVLSTLDPRTTFLDLLRPHDIAHAFAEHLGAFRMRGTTAVVHLALDRRIEFASRPGERVEHARTGGHVDDLERAFDPVKYGRFPEIPLLDIRVPTVTYPGLAPDGHDVVTVLANFVPFELRAGWDDAQRHRVGDAVVAELDRVAPGIREAVVGRYVLTPADIAERYGVTGGHIHHGEHALDQLLTRPTPETARYASPVRGLYIGGSGAFPGGGATCAPGALSARAMLR